jgi:uncharacterized protein (TIGR02391 family)
MAIIPRFDDNSLRALCEIIGDTSSGLTGREIGRLLSSASIIDIYPAVTKRDRLFAALQAKQQEDGCANNIINFIQIVMDPIRYAGSIDEYEARRSELNYILAFRGYEVSSKGKLQIATKVETLTEAKKRAKKLKHDLEGRGIHADVLLFCKAELLDDNYFHAVFEATKSVADKIRSKTGLTSDGSELVDEAFSVKYPLLALNKLVSETEKSEQKGFANLLKGVFGTFRNTTAHAPKIKWPIEEQDALDLLTMTSYAHRRLDSAIVTGFKPKT